MVKKKLQKPVQNADTTLPPTKTPNSVQSAEQANSPTKNEAGPTSPPSAPISEPQPPRGGAPPPTDYYGLQELQAAVQQNAQNIAAIGEWIKTLAQAGGGPQQNPLVGALISQGFKTMGSEEDEFTRAMKEKTLRGMDIGNAYAESGVDLNKTFIKMLLEGKLQFRGGT